MQKILLFFAILLYATAAFAQAETANSVYNAALDQYKKQDFAAALISAQRAIQMKASPDACYLVALCHKKLNSDKTTLRQAYQNVLNINPNHADALTQIGIMCFNEKNFAEAETYLQRALVQQPSDKTIQNFLAQAQTAKEKTQKGGTVTFADEKGADAAKKAHHTTTIQRTGGESSSETVQSGSGLVVQNEPKNYVKAYNIGIQHLNDKEFEQAVAAFREALDFLPNNARALYQLGNAYANISGEHKNADKYLAKATKNDPENAQLWAQVGDAYFTMNNTDNALKSYLKAHKLGLKTSELYQQIALVYYNTAQEEEATEWFKKAIVLTPNDPILYYNMGTALLVIKKWHKGIETLQRAIALDNRHLEARFNMSRAYYQLQQYDQSLAIAKESIAIDADFARGYFACAKAYRGLQDSKNSEKYLAMAYRLDPKLKLFDF
jgi:tetratricopeptide (TPR) repeat protein